MLAAAIQGFLLGASLIVAIGAQNAFVLRQGLARRQVFAVTTFCFLADALLIALGVAGVGSLVQSSPGILFAVTLAGSAFLFAYGVMALRRALHPGNLSAADAARSTLGSALATAAALTFLNPHVYLDTIVLLGSLSARHAGAARIAFGAGAALASALWFYGLGFGARLAAPLFARPAAWRILDGAIAVIMASIAISLLVQLF
ncbi:amino acid transporter [Kaistia algarum]|uniref:LysE/ArgO family amino acid transporter n=1 Tax=Kaistia algarum TaxID=2083279 RepID=UPI000CE88652|nr:LysE family transporter [Kaistia algarum]MCX5512310.1 LysE family transporter [Kaistia algarum]PPE80401.1 amino acid transporter [Kaistia algarum]